MQSTSSLYALSQRLLRPCVTSSLLPHPSSTALSRAPACASAAWLPQPIRLRHVIVQNRAKRGLFAGKHVQHGNSVSHSHRKTRRTWSPNVQVKWYFSELLQERFHVHVTTHAMRCIDKAGGFDHYLLFSPIQQLGEGFAIDTRKRLEAAYRPIKNRLEMEERLRRKAARLQASPTPLQLDASINTSSTAPVSEPERVRVPVSSTAV